MEQSNYIEIDLLQIAKVLRKKIWLIAIFVFIGAGAAFSIARFLVVPKYESLAKIYVNNASNTKLNSNQNYTNSDLQAAQSLVETYLVIMKSRPTLQAVIDNEKLPYTYEQLKGMVSGKAENETEIFSVTVNSADPTEAMKIVNGIVAVLPDQIAEIVEGASVRIVERGILSTDPVSPNYVTYISVGALIGLIVIIVILVIRALSDTKIHDEGFVEHLRGEKPLLAAIPELDPKKPHKSFGYGYRYYKYTKREMEEERKRQNIIVNITGDGNMLCGGLRFSAAEAYKLLRINVLYSLPNGDDCRVIGATSCTRGEGKTTTCINLAYTFAETGKRVLLIEGDMRLPNIADHLNLRLEPGLSNAAGGFVKVTEAIQQTDILKNFYVITAGKIPPNPTELLGSKYMENMMKVLKQHFDIIIIDVPPVNLVSDALSISPYLDGMLMIVRENYSDLPAVKEAVQRQLFADIKILGYVLTRSSAASKIAYHQYEHTKGKGYADAYTNKERQKEQLRRLSQEGRRRDYPAPQNNKSIKIGKPSFLKKPETDSTETRSNRTEKPDGKRFKGKSDFEARQNEKKKMEEVSKSLEDWVLLHEKDQ